MSLEKAKQLISQGNIYKYHPLILSFNYMKINCYGYILNSKVRVSEQEIYFPGRFSGFEYDSKIDTPLFLKRLLLDFETLGFNIKKTTKDSKIPENSYKICVFHKSSCNDFHFLRNDNQGFWSHKPGWYKSPTNKDYYGRKILNPENLQMTKEENTNRFSFVTYYIVKRKAYTI